MLSTLTRTSVWLHRAVPRAGLVVSRGLATSTADLFKHKESVEENKYLREQEKKFFEAKKAEKEAIMKAEELKHFEEVIAPAMAEAEAALKASGDKVSYAGLEVLARWKTKS